MNNWIVVDVESDGPLLGENSMVCFGAVYIDKDDILNNTFYGQTKPISNIYDEDTLAVSGFTRKKHENFFHPKLVMSTFKDWIHRVCTHDGIYKQPILISDNNGYDASWINWYFIKYLGENPFGWSSRRIGDLYCGLVKNSRAQWKKLRKTKHTHHPIDDAMGNAEVILYMKNEMGLKI